MLEPWAAIIAGLIGTCIFEATAMLWLKLKIDDPLLASPMHGICGAWALLWVGCMAKKEYVIQYYGGSHKVIDQYGDYTDSDMNYPFGLFYPGGGGRLLASQVIGVLVIFGWVSANMIPFFYIFKAFGMLRISAEEEQAGLDVSKHGGSAYPGVNNGTAKPGDAPAVGL